MLFLPQLGFADFAPIQWEFLIIEDSPIRYLISTPQLLLFPPLFLELGQRLVAEHQFVHVAIITIMFGSLGFEVFTGRSIVFVILR